MTGFDLFESTPTGSLGTIPERDRGRFIDKLMDLPPKVFEVLNLPRTGSYLRGLVKNYRLSEEKSAVVAFAVLRVAIGEKTLAQLASLLSTELKLPNDKAQKMAKEIEKDLFGPVMKELEEYWQKKGDKPEDKGARNILDLKQEKKPPAPPPMPM